MDQHNPALGLWSGSRIGKRRWQQEPPGRATQPKTPNSAVQQAALPAGQISMFNPHELQLFPGELISGTPLIDTCSSRSNNIGAGTGSDNTSSSSSTGATTTTTSASSSSRRCSNSSSSSSSRCYRLESELHRGPRSAVWKAAEGASGQPVALKVLGLGSTEQAAAALRELSAMQQICPPAAAAAGASAATASAAGAADSARPAAAFAAGSAGVDASKSVTQQPATSAANGSNTDGHASNSTGSSSSSSGGGSSHLVRLLDAFLVQQQQQQQCTQQHNGTQSKAQKQRPSNGSRSRSISSNAQAAAEAPSVGGGLQTTQHLDVEQQQQQVSFAAAAAAAAPFAGGGLQAIQQHEVEQQQQQVSRAAAAIHSAARDSSSSSSGNVSALVLVLPQLHQSLSWVLHWVHQRKGRSGLPPAAVRSFAYQLLSALAELHDEHGLVHRDVKPSNMLLQRPFVVRSGKKHMMRSMSLQELTSAQWTLVDLGSAGHLLPPTHLNTLQQQQQQQQLATPQGQHHHQQQKQQQEQHWGMKSLWSQLWGLLHGRTGSTGSTGRTGHTSKSGNTGSCRWQVAAGDVPGYESVSYVPPEAILHCPSTSAYDIWSAACSIFEAATGRRLFPVEEAAAERLRWRVYCMLELVLGTFEYGIFLAATCRRLFPQAVEKAAAERRSITDRVYRSHESSLGNDDISTSLDEVHLALIKGLSGPVPQHVLSATSNSIADALFMDTATGRLWLSEEEEDFRELQQWRHKRCRPLLHKLMERRNMTLDQALELVDFLQPMLAWDPDERPTAAQLLTHPYFKPMKAEESGRAPR